MNKNIFNWMFAAVLLFGLSIAVTSCKDDDNGSDSPNVPDVKLTTLNVDVVLPAEIRARWQPTIDWALSNIKAAQSQLTNQVRLNLRYHNEDVVNLDSLANRLTDPEPGDDTCHAVIGPYHSTNASYLLNYASHTRLPVIMPTCTSSELQRTNSRNTYAWFLTESDVTQCEIMVSGAARLGEIDLALIYSDDTYGQSFRDWFGYYATEHKVNMAGEGVLAYKQGADITSFLNDVGDNCRTNHLVMCIALGDAGQYEEVTEKVRQWTLQQSESEHAVYVSVILSDTGTEDEVVNADGMWFTYGVTPTASPNYGFPQSYETRFNKYVRNGEAQMYDALMMLALGATHQRVHGEECKVNGRQVTYTNKPFGPTLTDHMRSVVASKQGKECAWDVAGMAKAFKEVDAGNDINLTGASGSLNFDNETYTKVLGTDYMLWRLDKDEDGSPAIKPLLHLSADGTGAMASTTSLWELENMVSQSFDDIEVDHQLPRMTDRWAVLIGTSTSWSNYRHQADVFAIYQSLRHHGYDDDHIVLIVEDNLANNSLNPFPGEIFVERSSDPAAANDQFVNDNVRKNAVVDYHFSDLQPDDLADIMMGRSSERLPHVIHSTATSNVFLYWSGHGGSSEGPLWGDENATQYFGLNRISALMAQMWGGVNYTNSNADLSKRHYRRMMIALETCFSGLWGEVLEKLPDLMVITAANAKEKSKADIHDRDLGVYLSNAFARVFRRTVDATPNISIYDLYRNLFRATRGSHVSLYNQNQYGSVYKETMSDFLE